MCRPTNTARGRVLLSWLSGVVLLVGCNSSGRDFKLISSGRDDMAVAVSDQPADVRREAATRVAESRSHDEPWAREGFTSLALLDEDTQTRCVAMRALGDSDDPNATLTLLRVLKRATRSDDGVREPSAGTRWDAAKVLADRLVEGKVIERDLSLVVEVLGERLQNDLSKHVRGEAARGLGGCVGQQGVFEPLFAGLKDREFSVVFACEDALIALTGVTHDADPQAWASWYQEHQGNAFVGAGRVPESRQRSKWRERWKHTRRFMGIER